MIPDPEGEDRIGCYAVVAYVTGPLGAFVEEFRRETDPSCDLRAHLTLLPPRLLRGASSARKWIEEKVRTIRAFEIEVGGVDAFELTRVVYLAVEAGTGEVERVNRALDSGPLSFTQPYPFLPHITLAQETNGNRFQEVIESARRQWADYPHPRRFRIDRLTVVENTAAGDWVDLVEFRLGDAA